MSQCGDRTVGGVSSDRAGPGLGPGPGPGPGFEAEAQTVSEAEALLHTDAIFSSSPSSCFPLCLEDAVAAVTRRSQRAEMEDGWMLEGGVIDVFVQRNKI